MNSRKLAINVLKILEHEGIRKGDFEKSCGVAAGYLSRIARGTVDSISLDLALVVADMLDEVSQFEIDLYSLIDTDWDKEISKCKRAIEISRLQEEKEAIERRLKELE